MIPKGLLNESMELRKRGMYFEEVPFYYINYFLYNPKLFISLSSFTMGQDGNIIPSPSDIIGSIKYTEFAPEDKKFKIRSEKFVTEVYKWYISGVLSLKEVTRLLSSKRTNKKEFIENKCIPSLFKSLDIVKLKNSNSENFVSLTKGTSRKVKKVDIKGKIYEEDYILFHENFSRSMSEEWKKGLDLFLNIVTDPFIQIRCKSNYERLHSYFPSVSDSQEVIREILSYLNSSTETFSPNRIVEILATNNYPPNKFMRGLFVIIRKLIKK